MTACPKCGEEMSTGYLGTKTWPTGLQWYGEVSSTGFKVGDPVATIHKLEMEFLEGGRCENCRVMVPGY